jgi:hypothetical protein
VVVLHLLGRYWAWAGSNVGAMPACGAVAFVFAFVFRDRLGRAFSAWWHRHLGHSRELAEIRAIAEKAHRISADTPRALTGQVHPDAPTKKDPD